MRMPLVAPHEPIDFVWFVESGIVSMVAESPDGRQVEVGIVGREGMVDPAMVNGADRSPLNCFVQVAGEARRMPAAVLRAAIEDSASLRLLLARYVQTLLVQISHTALANAANTIEQRLARWLVMSGDRIDGAAVPMTHEFLAVMLGVRRAGVTVAVRSLAALGLIEAARGQIAIRDRAGLVAYSRAIYGPPEAEYVRLIGRDPFA